MEPMKPMEPMEPMQPIVPMKPMTGGEKWCAGDLGQPSTSGGQNEMRYAFFPDKRRLLINENGKVTTYDTGSHSIGGVSQEDGNERTLTFTSQSGPVKLSALSKVT